MDSSLLILRPARWLRLLVLVNLLGLLSGNSAAAQAAWQADPVLSEHLIFKIVQDPDGFLWIATDEGVYRYDGYRTVSISHLNVRHLRLPLTQYQLALGRHGELWIYGKPGLFCYSTIHQCLTAIPLPSDEYTAERQALAVDTIHDQLWLNCKRHNVLLLQFRLGRLLPAGEWTFPCAITSLTPTATGGVWVQTANNQRITYVAQGQRLRSYQVAGEHLLALPDTHPQQFVSARALYECGITGQLRAVQRWRAVNFDWLNGFNPLLQPGHEKWVSSGQLVRLKRQASTGQVAEVKLEPAPFSNDDGYTILPNYSIFTDALGTEWCFSAALRGCYKRGCSPFRRLSTATGTIYSSRAIQRLPDQRLLISSYSGYLLQSPCQPATARRSAALQPANQTHWLVINDLLALSATQLLAADENGFFLINPTTWHQQPLLLAGTTPLRATVLAKGEGGRVWAGTQKGLYWLSSTQPWLHPYQSLPTGQYLPDIRAMQYDRAGYLWLATTGGLYRLQVATGRLRHFAVGLPAPYSLPTNELLSLALIHSQVWLGTRDQGLLLVDPDRGMLYHRTTASGLPSNTVCSLLPDSVGALWLGTYAGVVRYQLATGQLSVFTTTDGLADNECNYQSAYRDANGLLYFGSIKGVTRINPCQLPNQFSPRRRLVFTRIARYPGQDTTTVERYPAQRAVGRLILFDSDEATVKVALTDYLNPNDTRYYYRLRGLADTAWHSLAPIRTVRLLFLPVGSYTLEVKAESAAGVVAANRLYLPLEIHRSWWRYSAVQYGGALLLLAGAIGYVRRSRWLRQQQQLALRRRLAHDLHDELGSLLVRASLQAQLLKEEAHILEPAANHLIKELRGASQAMRDIVWSIDTHSNTLGSLLDRMREHLDQLRPPVTLRISFETVGIQQNLVVDASLRQHVYFIFKEAVTNSLRHAQQSNSLTVSFAQEVSCLTLSVLDNGQPISGKIHPGTGRRSMQQRAQAIGGYLRAGWLNAGGYEVLLSVPLRR